MSDIHETVECPLCGISYNRPELSISQFCARCFNILYSHKVGDFLRIMHGLGVERLAKSKANKQHFSNSEYGYAAGKEAELERLQDWLDDLIAEAERQRGKPSGT